MEFRVIRSDSQTLVTGTVGDPLVPLSFQERAHSSSLGDYYDFHRRRSTERAEEPDVTEPAEDHPHDEALQREAEPPAEPRVERPVLAPASETPT
jgi:hypothetical protein